MNKYARNVGYSAIAGLAGLLSGCAADGSPDFKLADDPLSKLFPILAPGVGHSLTDRNAGAALSDMGAAMGQQKAAREGRSEIVVNNYSGNNYSNSSDIIVQKVGGYAKKDRNLDAVIFATCHEAGDANGDSITMFPEEFHGLSNSFYSNEKICVYMGASKKINGLKYRLVNSDGAVVDGLDLDSCFGISATYHVNPTRNVDLQPGNYRANFLSDEGIIGSINFKVRAP